MKHQNAGRPRADCPNGLCHILLTTIHNLKRTLDSWSCPQSRKGPRNPVRTVCGNPDPWLGELRNMCKPTAQNTLWRLQQKPCSITVLVHSPGIPNRACHRPCSSARVRAPVFECSSDPMYAPEMPIASGTSQISAFITCIYSDHMQGAWGHGALEKCTPVNCPAPDRAVLDTGSRCLASKYKRRHHAARASLSRASLSGASLSGANGFACHV